MKWKVDVYPHTLEFCKPAGTSRGVYLERKVWYVVLTSSEFPGKFGIGECAPLPDLSCDAIPDYESVLCDYCRKFETEGHLNIDYLRKYPSILFAFETALLHWNTGSLRFWNTPFSRGEKGIRINGLIWMGNFNEMAFQIEEKLKSGFHCLKLKIGAISFEQELSLLQKIRKQFPPDILELRVDANGAFTVEEVLEKLKRLSELELHSIEQPIRAGQWEKMRVLTRNSPLPVALDEELIGINEPGGKKELLETIYPQYIILKPSLHGGISGCEEWISFADKMGIGWWITSALESNIGLNAIAQWTAFMGVSMPQGLGTGQLFTTNIDIPLYISGERLFYDPLEEKQNILNGIL